MINVFLSYSHNDTSFAQKIQTQLETRGAQVWMDEKDILVGESISAAVEQGISQSDYFCLIISNVSVGRPWVQREFRTALSLQLASPQGKPKILPLRISPIQVPILLRDIRYADFCLGFTKAFEALCETLHLNILPAPFVELRDLFDPFLADLLSNSKPNMNTQRYQNLFSDLEKNIWKIVEQTQRELSELNPSQMQIMTPESYDQDVVIDANVSIILRLPPLEINTYADFDKGSTTGMTVHNLQPLAKSLITYWHKITRRELYLLPEYVVCGYDNYEIGWKEIRIDLFETLNKRNNINENT